jgi:hypothetical protein
MNTTNERRELLRRVMTTAWGLFRADPSRPFAAALAGAWRWVKKSEDRAAEAAAWLRRAAGRHVRFGSMVASPIRRSLTGQAYAGAHAAAAGYLTSRIGA